MAPVWGQTLVLVLMIGMTAWFQGNVARANRSASAASAQVIEASEVRALSRAIQRDSLKLTIEVWNDRRKDLRDLIDARGQQLLVRARKLAEMVGQDDVDFSHDFVALQETVVKEIGAVETAALSNDVAGARENFIKRVEPAEKAASKKTDAFIDAGEARAAGPGGRGGSHPDFGAMDHPLGRRRGGARRVGRIVAGRIRRHYLSAAPGHGVDGARFGGRS